MYTTADHLTTTYDERLPTEKALPEFKGSKCCEGTAITSIVTMPKKELEEELNDSCQVCFDYSQDSVIFNCGHGGLCFICALKLICSSGVCHLCRQVCVYNRKWTWC